MRAIAPLLIVLLVLASGCVERWIQVRSDPPGARVFLDGQEVGITPARIPFHHYGTREVLLRHEEYASVSRLVEISTPWYQWFPIDIVTEHLWPWTLEDVHAVDVTLPPLDLDDLDRRLKALANGDPDAGGPEGTLP